MTHRPEIYWEQVYPNLPKRHAQTLEAVKTLGRCTSHEAQHEAGFSQRDSISNRLAELVISGVLREDGTKACSITGNEVTAFTRVEGAPEALDKEALRERRLAGAIRSVKRHSGAKVVILLDVPDRYILPLKSAVEKITKALEWMERKTERETPWTFKTLLQALLKGDWR